MKRTICLLLLAATIAGAAERAPMPAAKDLEPIGFSQVVSDAYADAKSHPLPANVRYLDARHLPPVERRELYAVIAYHVNGLSRESKRVPPRRVTDWLWAIDLTDYRWSSATWEDLKRVNHYFTINVSAADAKKIKKTRQVTRYDQYGRGYQATEEYEENAAVTDDFLPAPWLPVDAIIALARLTGSVTPIVRADEFLFQTAAQVDRKGHGYYDWLSFKSRKDVESLAALDRKKAEELYRETAAIIPVSGVSPNNRQVFRYSTLTGGWWETRDVFNSRDRKNATANLLEDYQHDAEEIVFTLPNGLPGFYLSDAKGVQVDSAPDTIAVDHDSTNNDRRVHPGYSCISCHQDAGLKPVRDYARRLYNPETGVSLATIALDPAKSRRLESAYLGPLAKAYKRDSGDFAEAIEEMSGLKPAELSKAFRRQWSRYLDDPVTLERAAAECGVTVEELRARLRTYAKGKGVIDPVLVGLLVEDPLPLRREHWEERFPVVMLILGGVNP